MASVLITLLFPAILLGSEADREPKRQCTTTAADAVTVKVIRHRWHTGFAIKVTDVPQGSLPELSQLSKIDFVEIGWGDKDFYMAAGDDYWLGFKALSWPTESVMHVVGIRQSIETEFAYSEIVTLQLTPQSFASLIEFIHQSFDRPDHDPSHHLGKGLYGDSLFFPATRSFHFFRTCNIWTSLALYEAGCPVSSSGRIFAGGVIEDILPFSANHRPRP